MEEFHEDSQIPEKSAVSSTVLNQIHMMNSHIAMLFLNVTELQTRISQLEKRISISENDTDTKTSHKPLLHQISSDLNIDDSDEEYISDEEYTPLNKNTDDDQYIDNKYVVIPQKTGIYQSLESDSEYESDDE